MTAPLHRETKQLFCGFCGEVTDHKVVTEDGRPSMSWCNVCRRVSVADQKMIGQAIASGHSMDGHIERLTARPGEMPIIPRGSADSPPLRSVDDESAKKE